MKTIIKPLAIALSVILVGVVSFACGARFTALRLAADYLSISTSTAAAIRSGDIQGATSSAEGSVNGFAGILRRYESVQGIPQMTIDVFRLAFHKSPFRDARSTAQEYMKTYPDANVSSDIVAYLNQNKPN